MKRPTAIDLFSGAGGLSAGLEVAGFDVVASVEIDPVHCAVHKFNFPDTDIFCKDVRELKSKELLDCVQRRGIEDLDLLAGGPPCQGFSHMGYRQLDDPRNRLVFEFLRIVRDLRPKYFIFENVPGIISGSHRQFVSELVGEFFWAGYQAIAPARILNAAHYGVAQNRKRFILMGWRSDCPPVVYPSPTHTSEGQHEEPEDDLKPRTNHLLPTIGAKDVIWDLARIAVTVGVDNGIDPRTLDYSGTRSDFAFAVPSAANHSGTLCHQRQFTSPRVYGHVGSTHTTLSIERFKTTKPGEIEEVSRFFRLHPDLPSNTLRAGTDSKRGAYTAPRPIHYSLPRCISTREAARLHSFPDWFQFHRTIWHGFREIGNAVAPLFAKALGRSVVKALGIDVPIDSIRILPPSDPHLLEVSMNEACVIFGAPRGVIGSRDRKKETDEK